MWFPIFIAWLLKRVILRASGLQGYRTAVPFFLGLVLGEFVVGSVWNILGLVRNFVRTCCLPLRYSGSDTQAYSCRIFSA